MSVIKCSCQYNIYDAKYINPFHAAGLFEYPQKTSQNFWFPDVFREYRKRPVGRNGLTANIHIK